MNIDDEKILKPKLKINVKPSSAKDKQSKNKIKTIPLIKK